MYSHRHHSLSQLGVLADDGCVDVLAEGRSVVIDISQVDVHSGHVTERWWAAICSLDGDVVFMGDLVVQRLNHKDVAWGQKDSRKSSEVQRAGVMLQQCTVTSTHISSVYIEINVLVVYAALFADGLNAVTHSLSDPART